MFLQMGGERAPTNYSRFGPCLKELLLSTHRELQLYTHVFDIENVSADMGGDRDPTNYSRFGPCLK